MPFSRCIRYDYEEEYKKIAIGGFGADPIGQHCGRDICGTARNARSATRSPVCLSAMGNHNATADMHVRHAYGHAAHTATSRAELGLRDDYD
jgi:hypothetical protein